MTITNTTSTAIALVYGTSGSWKRLPRGGGVIAPGASGGVGVGLADFTGYFRAMGASNYVAIHCIRARLVDQVTGSRSQIMMAAMVTVASYMYWRLS